MLINYNTRCGRDYCDAKMVMSAADAMVTNGMKEMGYEYIIISGTVKRSCILEWFSYLLRVVYNADCWADHRAPDGTIVADKDRFPE